MSQRLIKDTIRVKDEKSKHFPVIYVSQERVGVKTSLSFEEAGDELVARIHERPSGGGEAPEVRIKSRSDALLVAAGLMKWADRT